jgi:hypothetical protein
MENEIRRLIADLNLVDFVHAPGRAAMTFCRLFPVAGRLCQRRISDGNSISLLRGNGLWTSSSGE